MKRKNAAERYYKKNLIVFSAVLIPLILIFVALAFAFNVYKQEVPHIDKNCSMATS